MTASATGTAIMIIVSVETNESKKLAFTAEYGFRKRMHTAEKPSEFRLSARSPKSYDKRYKSIIIPALLTEPLNAAKNIIMKTKQMRKSIFGFERAFRFLRKSTRNIIQIERCRPETARRCAVPERPNAL